MGTQRDEIKGLVSVIIVTYRRLNYLKETIQSVLNQSFNNIEVVVASDGYESDVEQYVNELKAIGYRISYCFTEHCGYPAKPRNFALSKCNGEYIAFCDDDDLWEKDKIAKQFQFLESNPAYILCATNRSTIDSNNKPSSERKLKWLPKRNFNQIIFLTNYITYSSVMTRIKFVFQAGAFKDDPKFRAVEDYHLWLKLSQAGKFNVIDSVETYYRVHATNISKSLSEGNKKLLLVFNDAFSALDVSPLLKSMAYLIVYFKIICYKVFNK
ncbi:hypothetical protein BCY89_14880 [Sphingobacterium siyangense]|uniref:Glycosyltransferase 2-like domain-containing protein n=1 Tax=Sphingobacterium siyangense TaxID=459529 RepID=A0A420FHS0_9SPHI|nr:glycosyltransferase [Sphingobacterium siyangense]QRY58346.1 glycosyltransferase [Sphingobacterium siyangense]RKF32461.1 hypothetical protein BCY89_14880 [Sphingobacterium siyangense]